MHMPANPLAVQATNFYSAAELEQQIQARRAALTGRRLRKVAAAIDASSPEEALFLVHWLEPPNEPDAAEPVLAGDEYRPSHPDSEI